MLRNNIPRSDFFLIALFGLTLGVGVLLLNTNISAFKAYIDEDGIVEWLTVAALLAGACLSLWRFITLRKKKETLFLIFLLLTAAVFIFGAGEEISWGQRLFDLNSSTFFKEHNTQGEINIHNLVFGNIRINKVVFSLILGGLVALFLFLLPILYRKSVLIKKLADACALPVPRNYQILCYIFLFIVNGLIKDSRKWELLEMGGALLFLLIFWNPLNRGIYNKKD